MKTILIYDNPIDELLSLIELFIGWSEGDTAFSCTFPLKSTTSETPYNYYLYFSEPEIKRYHTEVLLDNNRLIIWGIRKTVLGKIWDKPKNCFESKFYESFILPHNADNNKIKARLLNSTLEIIIPKRNGHLTNEKTENPDSELMQMKNSGSPSFRWLITTKRKIRGLIKRVA
jgi:HSP20 family molecular chaperone IbpA